MKEKNREKVQGPSEKLTRRSFLSGAGAVGISTATALIVVPEAVAAAQQSGAISPGSLRPFPGRSRLR